jgi:site-specific recombinase XerD
MEPEPRKLLDQVWDALRLKRSSIRTEQASVNWIKRFILFHHKRHPRDMGVSEVEAFLSSLAGDERVAASTQNQTLSALLFLSREVLHQDLGPVDALRARKPKCLLTVLVCSEAQNLLSCLSGAYTPDRPNPLQQRPPLDGSAPLSIVLTNWLSSIAACGSASRPDARRTSIRSVSVRRAQIASFRQRRTEG